MIVTVLYAAAVLLANPIPPTEQTSVNTDPSILLEDTTTTVNERPYVFEAGNGNKHETNHKDESSQEVHIDFPQTVDINSTIDEVEQILAANPELPQLSRSEIDEILESVLENQTVFSNEKRYSEEEITALEDKVLQIPSENGSLNPENYKSREEYLRAMRALMLVLPFNAKNLSETKMKELYTKAPITRLVGENHEVVSTTTKQPKPLKISSVLPASNKQPINNKQNYQHQTQHRNHHEIYHQPYDLQSIPFVTDLSYEKTAKSTTSTENIVSQVTEQSTTLTTEKVSTTKKFHRQRPNYHHRRRRPTIAPTKLPHENYNNRQSQTTELYSTEQAVTTVYPERYHDRYNNHYSQTKSNSTEKPITTIYPEKYNKKNVHHNNTKLYSTEQPVTTVYPEGTSNHRVSDVYYQSSKLSVTTEQSNVQNGKKPPKYNQAVNTNDDTQTLIQEQFHHTGFHSSPSEKRTKPSRTTVTELSSTTESIDIGLDLPHDMKNVLISFSVDDHISKTQNPSEDSSPMTDTRPIFITPATNVPPKRTTGSSSEPNKYSSQYSVSELLYEKLTTEKPTIRDDVKEILASIGLFPDKQGKTTEAPTTATTTTTPDIAAAAESLSSEVKDLLISFGLLPSANDIQRSPYQESANEGPIQVYDKKAASPVVDPSSYISFKPLPLTTKESTGEEEEEYSMSSDMKQFLASFGLVPMSDDERDSTRDSFSEHENVHGFRSHKSLDMENETLENNTNNDTSQKYVTTTNSSGEVPHVNTEMLTDEMKEVLENLGFLPTTNVSTAERKANNGEGHIFNPSAHLASLNPTEEEAQKLSKLLDTIKKLMKENGTISQDEIDALNASISFILPPVHVEDDNETFYENLSNVTPMFIQKKGVNKTISLSQIKDAPDPLSLEELLLQVQDDRNEVKRQQPNNGTSNNSTEETTQDSGPSLTDLAASFGGGETASDDASVDDSLPPRRPNGLYFLLDWNSFLDVGVDGSSRKVNLQFTPKLGNSRAFLPVTVP